MTERSIQIGLYYAIGSAARCALPNYTPVGWFECDLASVSKSGFFTEYEIKLTAADLKADGKKRTTIARYREIKTDNPHKRFRRIERRHKKHDQLKCSDTRGPSRYYMVVPAGLVDHPAIPPWAGIIRASEQTANWSSVRVIRQPQRLHVHRVDPRMIRDMFKTSYYRAWSMICRGAEIVGESERELADE